MLASQDGGTPIVLANESAPPIIGSSSDGEPETLKSENQIREPHEVWRERELLNTQPNTGAFKFWSLTKLKMKFLKGKEMISLNLKSAGSQDPVLGKQIQLKTFLKRTDLLNSISHPWHHDKRREYPGSILVLEWRKYKVYTHIYPTAGLICKRLAVLDTGAGPNLIRPSHVPRGMEDLIAYVTFMDIDDANNRPMRT